MKKNNIYNFVAALFYVFLSLFITGTCSADDAQPQPTIVQQRGGRVSVVQYDNGKWQLLVDGRPYIVKSVEYSADKVGTKPEKMNMWMISDENNNGLPDGPYDSWVDENENNVQDENEMRVGDFRLLKEMGCNTIRIYHPDNINKSVLKDLYENFGIMVIMGNFFGAYTVGSEADWDKGTDYTDELQKQKMMDNVKEMVLEYKDEPYVLMWMLGNENDSGGSVENSTVNNTNAAKEPEAYARFVNDTCRMIKDIDPNHPVCVCNGKQRLLSYYNTFCPDLDIVGFNSYAGAFGFGSLWKNVKETYDRPVLITEYGVDCYDQRKNQINEEFQAQYHKKAWLDIVENSYWGASNGNSIGGSVFCWLDKWWLCGSWYEHDIEEGAWQGPKIDGYFHDEWMGICGQGDGKNSPFLRHLRKVYFMYKELWNSAP
jgi:beta-glucuronidase